MKYIRYLSASVKTLKVSTIIFSIYFLCLSVFCRVRANVWVPPIHSFVKVVVKVLSTDTSPLQDKRHYSVLCIPTQNTYWKFHKYFLQSVSFSPSLCWIIGIASFIIRDNLFAGLLAHKTQTEIRAAGTLTLSYDNLQ